MWGANEGMGWWMVFGGVFWIVVLGVMAYAGPGSRGSKDLRRRQRMRRRWRSPAVATPPVRSPPPSSNGSGRI